MIRQSYTAVVERNRSWTGAFETEPYEAAWAGEAVFYVRGLGVSNMPDGAQARVQISPDGMHWCDEGTRFALPSAPDEVTFGRVRQFGGWLRIVGQVPPGAQVTVIVYLALKS
jgi:hypothetical protein